MSKRKITKEYHREQLKKVEFVKIWQLCVKLLKNFKNFIEKNKKSGKN